MCDYTDTVAPTPSTIPTSFVPKQPVRAGGHFEKSGGNTFLVVSLVILGIALLASAGVFGYQQVLKGMRESKGKQVEAALQEVNSQAVESFIRLRTRFSLANAMLDSRVAASGFFDVLETTTLQTVRFDSLSFTLVEDGSAEITMTGTARTFNALAAQSAEFAKEKRIKRAIFSDISVEEASDTVSFSLSADLDKDLLTLTEGMMPDVVEQPLPPVSTSTATTTP